MKRIIILLLLVSVFAFATGCNDDGDKVVYTDGDSDTVSVGDNVIDLGENDDDGEEGADDNNDTSSNDGWTKVY